MKIYLKQISLTSILTLTTALNYSMNIGLQQDIAYLSQEYNAALYNFIKKKGYNVEIFKVILACMIRDNNIFLPFNKITNFIKTAISKNWDFGDSKALIKFYLINFAYSNAINHFTSDKAGRPLEEITNKFKELIALDYCQNNEREAAKLILASIGRNNIAEMLNNEYENKFKNLTELIKSINAYENTKNKSELKLLNWALTQGETSLIELLFFKETITSNYQNKDNVYDLITKIIKLNKSDLLTLLLESNYNIDFNAKNSFGENILECTQNSGNKKAFIRLLEYKNLIINTQAENDKLYIMYLNPNLDGSVNIASFNL